MNGPGEPSGKINPYSSPPPLPSDDGAAAPQNAYFAGDVQPALTRPSVASARIRGGFLFRQLELGEPLTGVFTYTGWWFVQRIYWNEQLLWRKISWWTLEREIHFDFPVGQLPAGREGTVTIKFGPGLQIRRFMLACDGVLVYQEPDSP